MKGVLLGNRGVCKYPKLVGAVVIVTALTKVTHPVPAALTVHTPLSVPVYEPPLTPVTVTDCPAV